MRGEQACGRDGALAVRGEHTTGRDAIPGGRAVDHACARARAAAPAAGLRCGGRGAPAAAGDQLQRAHRLESAAREPRAQGDQGGALGLWPDDGRLWHCRSGVRALPLAALPPAAPKLSLGQAARAQGDCAAPAGAAAGRLGGTREAHPAGVCLKPTLPVSPLRRRVRLRRVWRGVVPPSLYLLTF